MAEQETEVTHEQITTEGIEMTTKTYDIADDAADRLNNNFTYHAPLDGQPERYEIIRGNTKDLAFSLATFCPPSRELSIALTKLEEAVFWANAAIARNEAQ